MRVLATLLLFALLATASAKSLSDPEVLDMYVAALSSVDGRPLDSDELSPLIEKLREKQVRLGNKTAFIDYLFDKTRQRFLRNYTEYATFSETLTSGTYNCLTGTALYALLLDHFGIPYQVIETNYHIFLIAESDNGRILLEATDAQNGFVTGEASIESRIKEYQENLPLKNDRKKQYYQYETNLYKQVTLHELEGLLYFNRAIVAYNQHDLPAAIEKLAKSIELYKSPRTAEFAAILQLTVSESTLDGGLKAECLRKIQHLRTSGVSFSARNH
jgi:hypothetical protein